MSDDEFLTAREVRRLTGVANRADQMRVLRRDGIPFQVRERSLLVSRHHTREWLAGTLVTVPQSNGIDWGAVR